MAGGYKDKRDEYHGPKQLGALTAGIARPVLRKLVPGSAQVLTDWEALVGPGLAARTLPRRLDRGTLVIACSGPTAMELTMLGPALIGRINSGLGRAAVQRLRFIQAVVKGPAPRPAPPPPVVLPAGISARLAAAPEGPLRDALEKLAQGVYRKGG